MSDGAILDWITNSRKTGLRLRATLVTSVEHAKLHLLECWNALGFASSRMVRLKLEWKLDQARTSAAKIAISCACNAVVHLVDLNGICKPGLTAVELSWLLSEYKEHLQAL